MEQGGGNFIRLLLQRALQELIDAEAAAVIGAGKYGGPPSAPTSETERGNENWILELAPCGCKSENCAVAAFFQMSWSRVVELRGPWCQSFRKPISTG